MPTPWVFFGGGHRRLKFHPVMFYAAVSTVIIKKIIKHTKNTIE